MEERMQMQHRHGDVILTPAPLPKGAKEVERETLAAMPCYGGECREELLARYGPDGEFGEGVGDYLCPPCTARSEKEQTT